MKKHSSTTEKWLSDEDDKNYHDRLERLDWLVSKTPKGEYWMFPGSRISKYLFEEARYCFVYGQFLASIVLGLSYIEQTLASKFYMAGFNNLERANISTLLEEALKHGLINQIEFSNLQRARKIRNPITHFRTPLHEDTIDYRAFTENETPYTVIEQDARHVMETALDLLEKNIV